MHTYLVLLNGGAPLRKFLTLGVEFGIVISHVHVAQGQHVNIREVLHGVLYPEAHNNGKKKKKKKIMCTGHRR